LFHGSSRSLTDLHGASVQGSAELCRSWLDARSIAFIVLIDAGVKSATHAGTKQSGLGAFGNDGLDALPKLERKLGP
jgi:hypothetical protein